MKHLPEDIRDYINQFEPFIQERLKAIRQVVLTAYPDCQEKICYGIVSFKNSNGYMYLSAFKKHIGLYPFYEKTELRAELEPFIGKGTKASLHFPHNTELPMHLIKKVIEERLGK